MEGVTYASSVLTRAVTLDMNKKYTESLVCYQEGIQILMEALKNMSEEAQKEKLRAKVQGMNMTHEHLPNHQGSGSDINLTVM